MTDSPFILYILYVTTYTATLCFVGCDAEPVGYTTPFEIYVYAQQWPASFCSPDQLRRSSKTAYCPFPANVSGWTNHGLWPSNYDSYPANCAKSDNLTAKSLTGIIDDMKMRWPSFYGPDLAFWNHEWLKHGTCALNISMLSGPFRYFNFGLFLNKQFDIYKMFSRAGVTTGSCYDYEELRNVARKLFNESVIFSCIKEDQNSQQYLGQIELCFDKNFNLNCNPSALRSAAKIRRSMPSQYAGTPDLEDCWPDSKICYPQMPEH